MKMFSTGTLVTGEQGFESASLNAVPDPAVQLNADLDLDLTFHFNADEDADPDPAPTQSDTNIRPLVYRLPRAPFGASRPLLLASSALHDLSLKKY